MDTSSGYWDVQSVNTDMVSTANATQNVSTAPKPKKLPDLPGKGARWAPDEPNGFVNPADASSVHTDTYSVGNDAKMPANVPEIVRTSRNEPITQNSPMETVRWTSDEPDGCKSHMDVSSIRRDAHCAGNGREMAGNESETIRSC